jgi:hypothetical protein
MFTSVIYKTIIVQTPSTLETGITLPIQAGYLSVAKNIAIWLNWFENLLCPQSAPS